MCRYKKSYKREESRLVIVSNNRCCSHFPEWRASHGVISFQGTSEQAWHAGAAGKYIIQCFLCHLIHEYGLFCHQSTNKQQSTKLKQKFFISFFLLECPTNAGGRWGEHLCSSVWIVFSNFFGLIFIAKYTCSCHVWLVVMCWILNCIFCNKSTCN